MPLIKHLQDTEPFNQLPDSVFTELREAAIQKKYPANHDIFKQNNPPTGYLYVIKEGLVTITLVSPGGIDMVVDYRKEGQFFGGTPIFTGEPYAGGARTVKPTVCYLIPADILHKLQKDNPQIGRFFTSAVLSRVRKLYSEIVSAHSGSALNQMEAYPFKKRLSEIMTTPAVTCPPETPVVVVARLLTEHNISFLVVTNNENEPIGIITGSDLVAKVLAPENVDAQAMTARQVMRFDPHTMAPETYMYEAMALMTRHRLNYLLVVDRNQLVGVVTPRDLMRYRSQKALLLLGNIREEKSIEGLASIRKELVRVARALLSETRSTSEVMEILSHIHHAIIRRTYQICLDEMAADGLTMPDIHHCFLVMGSAGRKEMLLYPDQDNGFIFENFPDDRQPEVDAFFVPFSEKLNAALAGAGYPLCDGGVMARNKDWRGRLTDWQIRLNGWLLDPEPTHVRNSSIFFDFLPLVGDVELAHELRDMIADGIATHQGFLYHMMTLDLRYKVPLGILGRFQVEKEGDNAGLLSVKYGGCVYIVDCVRMFALERGIQAISTLERLQALVAENVFATETAEHIRAAFEALIFLRLRHEIGLLEAGEIPSHFLDPHALSKTEQDLLRESFQAVSKLQDATKRHFSRTPF
ncbi:MAG: putative nucleotidyltransferase substrate binding domain-containing protein [Desulfuromonadales bacterium]|nr:putative nucleotidyltransferase substrate binding domain-containing protein [Desulfuromonadales bacterium]